MVKKMKHHLIKMVNGSTIKANSVTYDNVSSVDIVGGDLFVNGQKIENTDKVVNIEVFGDCDIVSNVSGDIVIHGNTQKADTVSGDLSVEGDVLSDISTISGDVSIKGRVSGRVGTLSGDIRCN